MISMARFSVICWFSADEMNQRIMEGLQDRAVHRDIAGIEPEFGALAQVSRGLSRRAAELRCESVEAGEPHLERGPVQPTAGPGEG